MPVMNSFTVDLEDWFQGLTSTNPRREKWASYEARLEANTDRLLGMLALHNVRATFFVLGHVADHYPDLVRRIATAGHEIGVHGYWHLMVDKLTPHSFADELERARESLAPFVNDTLIGHRAPYFSINARSLWAIDVLGQKGFRYDSSFFPTRNMLYGYPGAPRFPHRVTGSSDLIEFPISTARWAGVSWPIGGGFYMRSLPYAVIRKGIRQLNRQGKPAILYMHPWELDTGQNYSSVTLRERITHYYGRGNLEAKLHRLFADFRFVPLHELISSEHAERDTAQ